MLKEQDLKRIQVQQNKSLRQIFRIKGRTRLNEFYKRGHILKVRDLIDLSLLKISFRYVNDLLPARIVNLFELGTHDYRTRNRNNLRAIRHTANSYSKSFLGKAPGLWLHLNDVIKAKSNMKSFCKTFINEKLKTY